MTVKPLNLYVMSWFDKQNDAHLLHPSVREDDELDNAIDKAEYDIFNHFTDTKGEITLRGYDDDPAKADVSLRDAVKRTIANMVSFRLRVYDNQEGVTAIQQGVRSVSWSQPRMGGSAPGWGSYPEHWDKYLVPFDDSEVLYHV
jgi:hypothetical protein